VVIFKPLSLYSREKSPRYPLDRRLGAATRRKKIHHCPSLELNPGRRTRSLKYYKIKYNISDGGCGWYKARNENRQRTRYERCTLIKVDYANRHNNVLKIHHKIAVKFILLNGIKPNGKQQLNAMLGYISS
jgi:hypothetical protein